MDGLDQILRFVVEYPILWPVYFFGLYVWIIRPIIHELLSEGSALSRYDEQGNVVEELRLRKPANESEADPKAHTPSLQDIWRSGLLDGVSLSYKEYASSVAEEDFSSGHRHDIEQSAGSAVRSDQLPALQYLAERSDLLDREQLLAAAATPARMSYVLTDRTFTFFGLDKGFLSNNYESGMLPFPAIKRISYEKKWTGLVTMNIGLENETELLLKDMPDTLPAEYISKRRDLDQ